jgi:mRNA interferase RelE/StbE
MVDISISRDAQRQLDRLPRVIRARMLKLIERLRQWPAVSGAKPLSGKLAGRFRLRTGDYRLQFTLKDGDVLIERIGHRADFYKE